MCNTTDGRKTDACASGAPRIYAYTKHISPSSMCNYQLSTHCAFLFPFATSVVPTRDVHPLPIHQSPCFPRLAYYSFSRTVQAHAFVCCAKYNTHSRSGSGAPAHLTSCSIVPKFYLFASRPSTIDLGCRVLNNVECWGSGDLFPTRFMNAHACNWHINAINGHRARAHARC